MSGIYRKTIKVHPYLVAVPLVALAAALRIWPLHMLGAGLAWLTFYPAVMIAAVYGGLAAGLLATGLTCVTVKFLWSLLVETPFINTPADWIGMSVFVLTGMMISGVASAMRRSEARSRHFEAIVQSSDDAIMSKTLKGIITSWNDSAERLFGYTAEEMIGKPMLMLFPPERIDEEKSILEQIAQGQRVNRFETVRIRKDGLHLDVSVTLSPIFDKAGRVIGASKIARDITEQKRMENTLRESALYARSLIEASLDPLVTIGADGRIMDVNAASEKVTGIARAALIGSDFSDYFTEPEKARAGYQQVFEQGSVTDYPLVIRHVSGRLTEVLYNATLYRNTQGEVAGIFAAARDITERKKMEDELKRSNAELDQFAYAVSHDMRQPLRMVTSYLSLIEKALTGQLDEDTRQYLMYASDGARRMDQMILAMLDFSRVGRKTDPITPISTRDVLDDTLTILNPDIIASGATIEVTGDWPELAASRDELMRLLQNLIGNALKYHEPDQPPRVEIHATATPTIFRVTIRDHGIGIDPKQTERLFKVFSRLQARTRFEGTGVGLALCRKIVEHHGGRIGVESAGDGYGSTFWFELPLTPE